MYNKQIFCLFHALLVIFLNSFTDFCRVTSRAYFHDAIKSWRHNVEPELIPLKCLNFSYILE